MTEGDRDLFDSEWDNDLFDSDCNKETEDLFQEFLTQPQKETKHEQEQEDKDQATGD